MTETEKICYKRYKLAYIAFIAVYPFNLEKNRVKKIQMPNLQTQKLNIAEKFMCHVNKFVDKLIKFYGANL